MLSQLEIPRLWITQIISKRLAQPFILIKTVFYFYYLPNLVTLICVKKKKEIKCKAEYSGEEFDLDYDKLVIAVGANNNSYNIPGVEQNALFLKELADARKIRAKLLECFEHAMVPSLPKEDRQR